MSLRAGLAKCVTGVVTVAFVGVAGIFMVAPASAATIGQGPPMGETVNVAGSGAFTDTLSTPGFTGVVFTTTTISSGVTVDAAGDVATTGTLPVSGSPYMVSGTDLDGSGDMGSWSYSLTVTPDTIVQGSPTTGTVDVAGSSGFTSALSTPRFTGVSFTTTTPSSEVAVSTAGEITTSGKLVASSTPYSVSGTDTDADGDIGTWSYALTVTPDGIAQGSPTSGSTTESASGTFATTLTATSGIAPVTFVTSTTGFSIVSGDELKSTGPLSASGSPYLVSGTDTDSYADEGTWTFSLTVTASGGGGSSGSGTVLVQTSPVTGSVQSSSSGSFTAGPITVEGNTGAVFFVTTSRNSAIEVSSSGLITTTGPLSNGTYSVSGTDSDKVGDSGTWTFTLTVTSAVEAVSFDANGGEGVMPSESENTPTALSLNQFTWSKHTFVDWNTAADGSGVSYANGAQYSFSSSTKLFAQWKRGKAPAHTITFASNGGSGRTASEIHNTPTAISPNHFTRSGYTFLDWNTAAKGTGKAFKAGATYPFKTSVTLFVQWKKVPKKAPRPPPAVVTFAANGGIGSMPKEQSRKPTKLTANLFTRSGYTFVDWNTSRGGSAVSFSNHSTYSFSTSTTLYAQWKKIPAVIPPLPVPEGPQIGPFAPTSSTLSPLLESQIRSLAIEVKSKRDSEISLLGFGDKLTSADEANSTLRSANITLSRERAQAVATYLQGQLASLGVKGWSISIAAANTGEGDSGQAANSIVIAEIS